MGLRGLWASWLHFLISTAVPVNCSQPSPAQRFLPSKTQQQQKTRHLSSLMSLREASRKPGKEELWTLIMRQWFASRALHLLSLLPIRTSFPCCPPECCHLCVCIKSIKVAGDPAQVRNHFLSFSAYLIPLPRSPAFFPLLFSPFCPLRGSSGSEKWF